MITYAMHELDPIEFEGLCVATLQQVISPLVTRYSRGKDGGRDAYFEVSSNTESKNNMLKSFEIRATDNEKIVFQFKHIGKENIKFSFDVIKKEIKKIQKLIELNEIDHYVVLTNYSVGAEKEIEVRKRILNEVEGLKSCRILGREWFDITIDQHDNLKRYIPIAFNIGDVSQKFDHRRRQQSREIMDDWEEERSSFEETSTYLKAYNMVKENKILIVSGQLQSGKTSIARNICYSIMEKDENYTFLSLKLNEFKTFYNPLDWRRIYLFDDVFGERFVDDSRFNKLDEQMIFHLNKAIKSGSIVIFTSRDYILKEVIDSEMLAGYYNKFPSLFDENIILDIKGNSITERRNILLKHVKTSNMTDDRKLIVKTYSQKIASLNEFTPELARRLVDNRLNKNVEFTWRGIKHYFEKPIPYLLGLFDELDKPKKTAMLLMLLNEGQLPTFVDDQFLEEKIKILQEDIDASSIRKALPYIPNSLIRKELAGNRKVWMFHHPSIKEALLQKLVSSLKRNDHRIELFIKVADFRTLIDNITISGDDENRIFIPEELWKSVSLRLFETMRDTKADFDSLGDSYMFRREELIGFFASETNNDFLIRFDKEFSDSQEIWKQFISKSIFNQLHTIGSYDLAYRLDKLGLIPPDIKLEAIKSIEEVAKETFDVTFLEKGNVRKLIGEEKVYELLEYYQLKGLELAEEQMNSLFNHVDYLNEDYVYDLDLHFESWNVAVELLRNELRNQNLLSPELDCDFEDLIDQVEEWKAENIEENEMETEENVNLQIELMKEFIETAIQGGNQDILLQLVRDLIDKMVENLFFDPEDAVIYVGEVLNILNVNKEHGVITNLQEALVQYIDDTADDN